MPDGQSPRRTPRVSIIVPVFRPEPRFLRLAIQSVLQQTMSDWQLILVDDASASPSVTDVLEWAASDPRVDLVTLPQNLGISGASNAGLALVDAPLLGLLDHDDMLEPDALAEVVSAAQRHPDAEIIYSDRDAVSAGGIPTETFLKPDWSPERLRANMYIAHLTVVGTNAAREVGGFDSRYDGAQDHDLVLRISERGRPGVHIPRVLYHWRQLPNSTALDPAAKPYAADRGRAAVQAHLDRTGHAGAVVHSPYAGTYLVNREPSPCLASIVIPTRGSRRRVAGVDRVLVAQAARSIVAHRYVVDYEVVVVHDSDSDPGYLSELASILGDRLRVVDFGEPFNFSAKVNRGVEAARGEYVVLLNDDVEVISPGWLDQLVALAQYPDVGAVGAKLTFEDGMVQHAGHCFQRGQVLHIGMGLPDGPGPFASNVMDREVIGVTAACLAQRREVWERVGGLDETLPNNFNDVDFCWRIREAGYRVVQANSVRLVHHESQTRQSTVQDWEARRIIARIGDQLSHDPFTPSQPQSRSVREWFRVSREVLRQEGVKSFTAKTRKRLLREG